MLAVDNNKRSMPQKPACLPDDGAQPEETGHAEHRRNARDEDAEERTEAAGGGHVGPDVNAERLLAGMRRIAAAAAAGAPDHRRSFPGGSRPITHRVVQRPLLSSREVPQPFTYAGPRRRRVIPKLSRAAPGGRCPALHEPKALHLQTAKEVTTADAGALRTAVAWTARVLPHSRLWHGWLACAQPRVVLLG
jgi:hypothetical protein